MLRFSENGHRVCRKEGADRRESIFTNITKLYYQIGVRRSSGERRGREASMNRRQKALGKDFFKITNKKDETRIKDKQRRLFFFYNTRLSSLGERKYLKRRDETA